MSSKAGTTGVFVRAEYSAASALTRCTARSADCSPSMPSDAVCGWPYSATIRRPGKGSNPPPGSSRACRAVRTRWANRAAGPKPGPTASTATSGDPRTAARASAAVRGSVPADRAPAGAPTDASVASRLAGTFGLRADQHRGARPCRAQGEAGQRGERAGIRTVDDLAGTGRRLTSAARDQRTTVRVPSRSSSAPRSGPETSSGMPSRVAAAVPAARSSGCADVTATTLAASSRARDAASVAAASPPAAPGSSAPARSAAPGVTSWRRGRSRRPAPPAVRRAVASLPVGDPLHDAATPAAPTPATTAAERSAVRRDRGVLMWRPA